jgi:3' terminal RNA ribose 2'-O-methyltransferase Hen1
MLLTISSTHQPASDLGYLLHKHTDRWQTFELSFGTAHVFYPEVEQDRCEACLLLDADPVGMVRSKAGEQSFLLGQYVNDRPYVASSLMSVAIAQVFGSAMAGRCKDRPELVSTSLPLVARLDVLPVRAGEGFLHKIFEPLGYQVTATRHPLDEKFPEWGNSPYFSVTLQANTTLAQLLTHLYVLIPVFDNEKHYFVGEAELEKLLAKGAGWLPQHPEREQIARRFLRHRHSLYREALARLADNQQDAAEEDADATDQPDHSLETPLSLNDQRLEAVLEALRACEARAVLDLGCGEGQLIRLLLKDSRFERIVGFDVSFRVLESAQRRLNVERMPERQAARMQLLHGSLIYRDQRLAGFDAAAVVEVIEHLDPPRLAAFERVLFEFARPQSIVLTTPNREYNVKWESLTAGQYRHRDHRFEWNRDEFQAWASRVARQFGYVVRYLPIGPVDEHVGSPTQMGVFERA